MIKRAKHHRFRRETETLHWSTLSQKRNHPGQPSMPIECVFGDLFDNTHHAQAFAHGCNCQGAMGADLQPHAPDLLEHPAVCKGFPWFRLKDRPGPCVPASSSLKHKTNTRPPGLVTWASPATN